MNIKEQFSRAVQAHQAGQLDQARRLCEKIIAAAPDTVEARHMLGLILAQQGDYPAAAPHLRRAAALQPDDLAIHTNLGETLRRMGQLEEAVQHYQQALQLAPQFAPAHYNLANVLKETGQLEPAIQHYQQAVQARPNYAEALYNLGNTLLTVGQYQPAQQCFQRVLQLRPQHAEAYNNLGAALKELGQLKEAIAAYQQALRLKPGFVKAIRNIAMALEKLGQMDDARRVYQQLIPLEPDNPWRRLHAEAIGPLIPASNAAIDAHRRRLLAAVESLAAEDLPPLDWVNLHLLDAEPPHYTIYQGRDEKPLRIAWARLFKGQSFPGTDRTRPAGSKIHVGFVVTHGHEGVFIKCMRGLINELPRQHFQVTVVCSEQNSLNLIKPAIANPDTGFLILPGRIDRATSRMLEARFDVLHYWEIGTDATNYFLPFCRLAPVQCTSWGWPTTSGIPNLDYFISCAGLETAESDDHYTETLIRLERLPTYYYRPHPPETLRPRADFGLEADQHIYLCTQNLRKVHPDFDPVVIDILRGDPAGRVLFIEDKAPYPGHLLRQRYQQAAPDVANRIGIVPRLPEADYFSLIGQADAVLDTFHYGGGANTTYDAFAMGIPVVTMPTRFHRGRYATAAYHQIGLPDLIAPTPADFVALAHRLGTDPAYRARLSQQLTEQCPALFEDRQAVTELSNLLQSFF